MDINEILAPESQAEIEGHMSHVRANFAAGRWEMYVGRVDTLQLRHRRRDGSEFWGETSVSYVIDQEHHFAGIIGVARDITDRKETDRKMLEQQRALAALEEREYLARELHDNLGQVMGYIHLQVQTAAQQLRDGQVELCQATLQQLNEVSQDSYSDLREFLLGLRQKFSEAPDFFTALQKYTQDYSRAYGLPINLCCPDNLGTIRLDPAAEVHLLRIIQEALSNIRKHAHATKATIFFSRADGSTQVMIEDDGQGFDPADQHTSAADDQAEGEFHFGMDIMGERAQELGGSLQVLSAPGQGTRILVRLPDQHPQASSPRVSGLRVVLADDHPLFRDGLRNLLQARGVKVVGLAQNGLEAVERALALQPDVVILDIQMPEMDGLEACRQIKAQAPGMRVLMLTMASNANTLFEAVRAGASGYLLKDLDADQFLDRLEALVRGETPIASSMAGPLLQEFASHPEALDEKEVLNARQQEVLALMAQNLTYAQIAQRLYLSESTVKYHAGQIMEKLGTDSRSAALAEATRRGWIERRKRV
jgi:DNA-binding NarL/FixJ family response regulator/signal transduction histidine kinase